MERQAMTDKILPRKKTSEVVGLSARTIYREIKAGRFPKPVQLSARRVGWRESDLDAWLAARSAA